MIASYGLIAQSKLVYKTSPIQLGILPGLSTNGLNPGEYYNLISLNLFTGYGRSTKYLEINGLGGLNTHSSSGIFISGLSNVIGGNGQVGLTDREKEKAAGTEYAPELHGFQFAGLMNYVRYNSIGSQMSLGINNTGNYLLGVQLGGVFNYVGSFASGVQFALVGNITRKSMSGTQFSLLFNSSGGRHSGVQVAAINRTVDIGNPRAPTEGSGTGVQLGLLNICGYMGGQQIGLINIGDRVGGTQIGLINIFKNEKTGDFPDGPAYGLLNFGWYISPRAYISDLFMSNFGLNTGKRLNARVFAAKRHLYSYNEVVYSQNFGTDRAMKWGLSYRAGIISYYKEVGVYNEKNYFSLSGEIGHVNPNQEVGNGLNLRYAVHFEAGHQLPGKMNFINPFFNLSGNYMPRYYGNFIEINTSGDLQDRIWPGFAVGVMIR